jgi:hypothetical protein
LQRLRLVAAIPDLLERKWMWLTPILRFSDLKKYYKVTHPKMGSTRQICFRHLETLLNS